MAARTSSSQATQTSSSPWTPRPDASWCARSPITASSAKPFAGKGDAVRMVLDVELEPGDIASGSSCVFCAIVRGEASAEILLDDPAGVAFLDRRPLLPGHVLLVPRSHVGTLPDLPVTEVGPLFTLARRLT